MILSIDLGGTNTKMALVNSDDLRIVAEKQIPTHGHLKPQKALGLWLEAIQDWRQKEKIDLVGIGSPGPLDTKLGCILETPNLKGWAGFGITKFFEDELGCKAIIENDANCAAVGEWTINKIDHQVVLTLGTGVGSGVIVDGKLVVGGSGIATEAGHMSINFDGPKCGCGRCGCLEAYVGGRSLLNRYAKAKKISTKGLTPEMVLTRDDRLAKKLQDEWVTALAVGIGNLINIFNPQQVTLTGGLSLAFRPFAKRFQKILLTQAFKPGIKYCQVEVSEIQNHAGLLGAAYWAKHHG